MRSTAQRFCEHCGAALGSSMPPPIGHATPPPLPPSVTPPPIAHEPQVLPPPTASRPLVQAPDTGQFSDSPATALKVVLVSAAVALLPCCGIGAVILVVLWFVFTRRG